jgi:hypothetical protein
MKETPFDKEIEQAQNARKEAQTCLDSLLQRKAEYLCPFKVGDTLVSEKGRKVVVTRIMDHYLLCGYRLFGKLTLASGKVSDSQHELWQAEWDNAKLAPVIKETQEV